MKREELVGAAMRARENAYAPYSEFKVGAALLTRTGKIFTGCNVENASLGLTICAERVAVFHAIAAGETIFKSIAVVADSETPVRPCGACLQVLREFAMDLDIIMANIYGETEKKRLSELLSLPFGGGVRFVRSRVARASRQWRVMGKKPMPLTAF